MLRPRYFLVTLMSVAIFSVAILLTAVGCLPPANVDQAISPIDVQDLVVEHVDLDVAADESISAQTEPSIPQVAPLPDGRSLLESYCSQCHLAQLFEEVKKSRADWEKTLDQMEALGVHLDVIERVELLDYLAIPD